MKSIRLKMILVFALMFLLLIVSGLVLYRLEFSRLVSKEQEHSQIKLNYAAELTRLTDDTRKSSETSGDRRTQSRLRFMTSVLSEYLTPEGYDGPRLLREGAVVELRDDQVLWPEGLPAGYPDFSAGDARRGETVRVSVPAADAQTPEETFLCTPCRLSDDWYYIDRRGVQETGEDPTAPAGLEDFLKAAGTYYGGTMLLVSAKDSGLPLICPTTADPEAVSAAELGFTQEMIAEKRAVAQLNGESFFCTYAELGDGDRTLICFKPLRQLTGRAFAQAVIAEMTALVCLVTVIIFILTTLNYIKKHGITKIQAIKYHPKSLRRIAIIASALSALVIFADTVIFNAMTSLNVESIGGAYQTGGLLAYLQDEAIRQYDDQKERETEWYVRYGESIADQIARDPAMGSREKLREYCDIFGIDYIMVFDGEGSEVACSGDYVGFTMDEGLGENSADFRRLLKGIPWIAHDASADSVTGLTRQYVGVRIPDGADAANGPHGALIMAIEPREIGTISEEISRQFVLPGTENYLFCFADPESGRILYASSASLLGRTTGDCGLPEGSLRDGYTDFAVVDGVNSYVTTVRMKSTDFLHIISNDALFSTTLRSGLEAAVLFLAAAGILLTVCLWGYNGKVFAEHTGSAEWETEHVREMIRDRANKAKEKDKIGLTDLLISKSGSDARLEDRTPETHARTVFKINILLLILVPIVIHLLYSDRSAGKFSLIQYILHNDWVRGLNLFAFYGILTVMAIGVLISLLSNGILSLFARYGGKSTETVCRLLYSLVHYVVTMVVLYYVFDFIGLPMSTYIASLSVVSLALSIGSRDMVADILAGVLIVFEHQFRVGDIVEIDGYQGKVLEIGVRSTRLLGSGDDVRFFSNSAIRSIVNKSKRHSVCGVEMTVVTAEPLAEIEALFSAELPKIEEAHRELIHWPLHAGITGVSGGGVNSRKNVTVRVECECRELDRDEIEDTIRRELTFMCEREGIELR